MQRSSGMMPPASIAELAERLDDVDEAILVQIHETQASLDDVAEALDRLERPQALSPWPTSSPALAVYEILTAARKATR
ncbi:MAG: hypothetical protein NT062_21970 [Proteobacteria bacterium]|nr:hypothetical protein [Pseudomonadota bacterium]